MDAICLQVAKHWAQTSAHRSIRLSLSEKKRQASSHF
jgi:hypothetical protein